METAAPAKRLTKTKARLSVGLSRVSSKPMDIQTEQPADLNGEKEAEQTEPIPENNKDIATEEETKKEEPVKIRSPQTRKRKLDTAETKENETQPEDSNTEFHGFGGVETEKPIEPGMNDTPTTITIHNYRILQPHVSYCNLSKKSYFLRNLFPPAFQLRLVTVTTYTINNYMKPFIFIFFY